MRVLTFNSHQPYLHLLASALPWTIGVVTPALSNGTIKGWDLRVRPLPANVVLHRSVATACDGSSWDWIIAHNVQDLLEVRDLDLPKVFLVHGTLSGRVVQDRSSIDRGRYLENLRRLLDANRCRVVYISELKREDWGIRGEVIRSAVDPDMYGGYRGDRIGILQVANYLRQRGPVLGWEAHHAVCRDNPSLVVGRNPGLANSRTTTSWEDLKEQYRAYRVYLHTAIHPYEDGFNLAMLEAMATGMPVATLDHPTSPIEDGVDGVRASSAGKLRESVLMLLTQPEMARRLGDAARIKVAAAFPLNEFRGAWLSLARSVAGESHLSQPRESMNLG